MPAARPDTSFCKRAKQRPPAVAGGRPFNPRIPVSSFPQPTFIETNLITGETRTRPPVPDPYAGIAGTIRPVTPADEERMSMAKKSKAGGTYVRADGTPRKRHPTRTFRASDATWKLIKKHGARFEGGASEWLRHAVERMAKEEERQAAYAAKKGKGKK
jgi:hypothetical protein